MSNGFEEISPGEFSLKLDEKQLQLIHEKFVKLKAEDVLNVAIEEFFDFMKNPKRIAKFSLLQEYRLFLLIKHIYKDRFVSELEVAKIFKVDLPFAKKMINNVKIDYEKEIQQFTRQSLKNLIETVKEEDKDGMYFFTCESKAMIDSLNSILQEVDVSFRKIVKESRSLCTYKIFIDEYNKLKKELSNE